MEGLGYAYSSDFHLGYDDYPFFPWVGDRFSRVMQVPVHPICEGLFLDAGCDDPGVIAAHLVGVVRANVLSGEPAFVYGHPERRLGRFPQVVSQLARAVGSMDRVWRVTLTAFARWSLWRMRRRWSLSEKEGGRYEVQFEDWDGAYPLSLEIVRGEHVASVPLAGPRQVVVPSQLAFAKQPPRRDAPRPSILRPSRNLKAALRVALDWETVTPVDELPENGLRNRLKKHLRKLSSEVPR